MAGAGRSGSCLRAKRRGGRDAPVNSWLRRNRAVMGPSLSPLQSALRPCSAFLRRHNRAVWPRSRLERPLLASALTGVDGVRGPRFSVQSLCEPEPRIRWARLPEGGAVVGACIFVIAIVVVVFPVKADRLMDLWATRQRRPQVHQPLSGPQLQRRSPTLVLGGAGKYLPLLGGIERPELLGRQIAEGAMAAVLFGGAACAYQGKTAFPLLGRTRLFKHSATPFCQG